MSFPVVKGVSYALIHTPGLLLQAGTTQALERGRSDSTYLAKLPAHLRSYNEVVAYPPNQVFIGNLRPDALAAQPRPWYSHPMAEAARSGPYGEIMPEDEFIGLMKLADSFDLVFLEKAFTADLRQRLPAHPVLSRLDWSRLGTGVSAAAVSAAVEGHGAEPLWSDGHRVGYVRRAHDRDESLSAHIVLENLAAKASGALAMLELFHRTGLSPLQVGYIIEASEEACGDMNQRGGGNFAKAIGEMTGCQNATGSDTRSFCAGPAHALVEAAALVQAGIFEHVVVVGGGAAAKLGMNGRDHVAKNLPVLEDVLGAFAICLGPDDGENPVFRTDLIGRHRIGSGSSPQAVMQAIVTDPLDRLGLKLTDIDKFAPEMQNPEITEPAGAGDVPRANYKMIAALGVKRGEIARADLEKFAAERGMPGYAPTQGHVPSGVPFIGPARDLIRAGEIRRAMIIGKGSLFLGRMTNQFDGVSFVLEQNPGPQEAAGTTKEDVRKIVAEMMRALADSLIANPDGRD